MSKAVLISIQPKWCELIAKGIKTVEARKTKPKLSTPFKVYIYCTKAKEILLDVINDGDSIYGETYHGKRQFIKSTEGSICDMYGKRQKVIGEFVCDRIDEIRVVDSDITRYVIVNDKVDMYITDDSRLSVDELYDYLWPKKGFAWHISNLVIYDEPKELSEFHNFCETYPCCDESCEYYSWTVEGGTECMCDTEKPFKRPPQSWCYVEELKL